MLTLAALVFVCVTLVVAGAAMLVLPSRTEQRVQTLVSGPAAATDWQTTFVRIAGPFAKLTTPKDNWDQSALRILFLHAGIRNPDARLLYFGAKAVLPIAFAMLTFVGLRAMSRPLDLSTLFCICLAALIGCYLPNGYVAWRVRRRRTEIFNNFPDATDLMLVCVEAGLGLDAAVAKVSEEMKRKSVALAEELHLTTLEMRAGATRVQSLRNLALRTDIEEMNTFATMMNQADKFGTSIGDSLRVFSDDLRHKRQIRAEEKAAKIPTKMLFPLVLFIFPSIILVVLGPAIIQFARTIAPMLGAR
jgi:tight adherence protein C